MNQPSSPPMLVSSPRYFDLRNEPLVPVVTKTVKRRERKFEFRFADAGSPKEERRDCTVQALALATGIPYTVSHSVIQSNGRLPRKGLSRRVWYGLLDRHFTRILASEKNGPTLNSVVPTLDKNKTYIISKRGHSFVVKEGVVLDRRPPKPMSRIKGIWEVVPGKDYESAIHKAEVAVE